MPRKRLEKPVFFVIHHSATNSLGVGIKTLKNERLHRNEGYNVIIDRNEQSGEIEFSQDVPDDQISNGTYGINSLALNICVNGNFEDRHPEDEEIDCLVQVLAVKMKRLGYRKLDVWRIIGHKDAGLKYSPIKYGTACPGRYMLARIPEIRGRVASYLPA